MWLWTRPILFVAALLLSPVVFAWGTVGHHVIAAVAEQRLTPVARAQIDRLLAQEPGASLVSISTWADEHRNPATAAWHYINFPKHSCSYEPERDCPNGNCVIEAINRQVEILASGSPDNKRLIALKWVVHLVADIHQPLHAGNAEDRGGNTFQLQAFMAGTNLHAVWDVGLIRNLGLSDEALTKRLLANVPGHEDLSPANIAMESCRIVAIPGFYPERKIDVAYLEQFTPLLERRLAIAGARLAAVLNASLR